MHCDHYHPEHFFGTSTFAVKEGTQRKRLRANFIRLQSFCVQSSLHEILNSKQFDLFVCAIPRYEPPYSMSSCLLMARQLQIPQGIFQGFLQLLIELIINHYDYILSVNSKF